MFRPQQVFLVTLLILLAYSVDGDSVEETLSTALPKSLPKPTSSPLLVFGILTQPFYEDESEVHGENGDRRDRVDSDYNQTYVAASYVKWLEDGGARSIPIPFDASPSLVEDILGQVDGVLFPGGASSLPSSAISIWEQLHSEKYYYPIEDDALGDRIPLWGTCLGMEFIVQLAADTTEKECDCSFNRRILEKGYDSTNITLPLLDVNRTGLYQPDSVYNIITKYNVTMNNHHLGISPQRFRNNSGLSKRFDITSINYDRNGKAFVSTIEPSKRYTTELSSSSSSSSTLRPLPIYGVQYHPEKNTHEYGFYPHTAVPYESTDHSPEGIAFSLYEARFLVNLARDNVLNKRESTSISGERSHNNHDASKYNKPDLYPMIYTYPRRVGYKFEESYMVPSASHWEREINNEKNNAGDHDVEERGKDLVNIEREATISMLRRNSTDPQQ
jgi:gamma-glutamyl hydrolase